MSINKTDIVSQVGYGNIVGTSGGHNTSFGFTINSFFKPFTTNSGTLDYPTYGIPILPTGTNYNEYTATAAGLNPFGSGTVGEGLLWGSGNLDYDYLNDIPDPLSIRTLGVKTPMNMIGWGFDIFGFPCPNANEAWETSGYYQSEEPSGAFRDFDNNSVSKGSEVSYYDYKAGPLDLRYDPFRKVWTSFNGGTYSAQITNTQVSGGEVEFDSALSYFAEIITYDVKIFDGVASSIQITGLTPISPRPEPETYKIRPLVSGDFCFVVHHPNDDDLPSFQLWCVEPPDTEACESIGGSSLLSLSSLNGTLYNYSDQGSVQNGTGILSAEEFFGSLVLEPLGREFGGTDATGLNENYGFFGDTSGNLVEKTFIAGTGIQLEFQSTGILIGFASGIDFIDDSGINSTISELVGLTTPLSISQGGTASSTKNFVDLTNQQNISGYKTFDNYTAFSTNDISGYKPIHFTNNTRTGINYVYSSGSAVDAGYVGSGILIEASSFTQNMFLMSDRNILRQPVLIDINSTEISGQAIPLHIKENFDNETAQDILRVDDMFDERIAGINLSGIMESRYHFINSYKASGTSPLEIRTEQDAIYDCIRIRNSGWEEVASLDATCTTWYLNQLNVSGIGENASGGYFRASGINPGYVDVSDNGGSINTSSGFMGFGQSGSQTYVYRDNATASGNYNVKLPEKNDTLATITDFNGWSGTIVISGVTDAVTLTFSSGLLTDATGVGVTAS